MLDEIGNLNTSFDLFTDFEGITIWLIANGSMTGFTYIVNTAVKSVLINKIYIS